jgi:hypothetical protein
MNTKAQTTKAKIDKLDCKTKRLLNSLGNISEAAICGMGENICKPST